MALTSNTTTSPWDNTSLLDACMKNKPMCNVYESLGLYSESLEPRKSPEFPQSFANELYSEIQGIASRYRDRCNGDLSYLRQMLAHPEIFRSVFKSDVDKLEKQFGPRLCSNYCSNVSSQDQFLDEEFLKFHLHCWILVCARRDVTSTPRKGKGRKSRPAVDLVRSNIMGERSASNPEARVGNYRAPEASMIPGGERDHSHAEGSISGEDSDGYSHSEGVRDEMTVAQSLSPSKRKAVDLALRQSSGKLPKVSRPAGQVVPTREHEEDLYSIMSPPELPGPSRVAGPMRFRRSGTMDTDRTYEPPSRDTTLDVETPYNDEDSAARELYALYSARNRPIPPRELGAEVQQAQISQNPSQPITDSVGFTCINRDTTASEVVEERQSSHQMNVENQQAHGQSASEVRNEATFRMDQDHVMAGAHQEDPILVEDQEDVMATTDHDDAAQSIIHGTYIKACRRNLWTLLLEYLLGERRFAKEAHSVEAEQRMDELLKSLLEEEGKGCNELHQNFSQLKSVLQTWIEMRQRVAEFRRTSNYFGKPGMNWSEWDNHVRQMEESRSRARAYLDLDDFMESSKDQRQVLRTNKLFNEHLIEAFSLLTKRMTFGRTALDIVTEFNTDLLEWFTEDPFE